jgi:hypothetical protein
MIIPLVAAVNEKSARWSSPPKRGLHKASARHTSIDRVTNWTTHYTDSRTHPSDSPRIQASLTLRTLSHIIGYAIAVAILTAVITFIALNVYFRIFEPADAADIRGWQTFTAAMGSLGMGLVALLIAAVYQLVRIRRRPQTEANNSTLPRF